MSKPYINYYIKISTNTTAVDSLGKNGKNYKYTSFYNFFKRLGKESTVTQVKLLKIERRHFMGDDYPPLLFIGTYIFK